MTPAEILRAAATRTRKTWRGQANCTLTQLNTAAGQDYQSGRPQWVYLCRAIGVPENDSEAVFNWNDADGQTAENVAQAMELAAILWEHEHAESQPESVPVTSSALGGAG